MRTEVKPRLRHHSGTFRDARPQLAAQAVHPHGGQGRCRRNNGPCTSTGGCGGCSRGRGGGGSQCGVCKRNSREGQPGIDKVLAQQTVPMSLEARMPRQRHRGGGGCGRTGNGTCHGRHGVAATRCDAHRTVGVAPGQTCPREALREGMKKHRLAHGGRTGDVPSKQQQVCTGVGVNGAGVGGDAGVLATPATFRLLHHVRLVTAP